MVKTALERLTAILSNGYNGYRDSAVTEATELLEIIRANRPDLYEPLLVEVKNRVDGENVLVVDNEPVEVSKSLKNEVSLQEGQLPTIYKGEFTNLEYYRTSNIRGIFGRVILTKRYTRKGYNEDKSAYHYNDKVWRLKVGGGFFNPPYFLTQGENIDQTYRKDLAKLALGKGLFLPQPLFDAVFNPLEEKLKKIYRQIVNGRA